MQLKSSPAAGGFGRNYMTHADDMPMANFAQLAAHTRLSPDEARKQMIDLINSIPDEDLNNYIAAQVTVVT